ncbi:MAG TPA: hypothetical protein VGB82_00140 [Alphaproteobacteria bacterium]
MRPQSASTLVPATFKVLLWLWVLGVLAGYLYQFRGFVAPLLQVMS